LSFIGFFGNIKFHIEKVQKIRERERGIERDRERERDRKR
jgi:hypothetical protein